MRSTVFSCEICVFISLSRTTVHDAFTVSHWSHVIHIKIEIKDHYTLSVLFYLSIREQD